MSEFTDRLVNVTQHALTDSGYMAYVRDAEKAVVAVLRELTYIDRWTRNDEIFLVELADEIEGS